MTNRNLIQLPIDRINLKDERFRISFFFSLEALAASVKEIGLIYPPVVTERRNRLVLVSGWKRVLACRELRFSALEAVLLDEKEDLQAFRVAFYENWACREFTFLEKAEIIVRLMRFREREETVMKHYLPLLRIPPVPAYLDLFSTVSRFEKETKRAIHEKNMPLSVVQMLVEFMPEEQRRVIPLLRPLNQNTQREFLEDVLEVSKREDISAGEVLADGEISRICASRKFSSLQKSEKVRLALKRKRFPHLSSWKDSFNAALKNLQWPKDVAAEPSPFFEDSRISVAFSVKDEAELRATLARLQEVSGCEELKYMFHPSVPNSSLKEKK